MTTLALSSIGTALGGPIGGAIGSLIGQSIDRQLFGPGPRHGPRLGDLSVQTSTYGSQIPRIMARDQTGERHHQRRPKSVSRTFRKGDVS